MSNPPKNLREAFDRRLIAYQKIALLLLIPALLSAFSSIVGLFNPSYGLYLCFALMQGLKPFLGEGAAAWLIVIGVGLAAIFLALSLFAAKGKGWCFFLGVGLYLADSVYSVFLFDAVSMGWWIFAYALRILFLLAFAAGAAFYFQAKAMLRAHGKEILRP